MRVSPFLPRLSHFVGAALLLIGLLVTGIPALSVHAQTTGEIEGLVFEDQNTNTVRDGFEPGIAGVSIQLRNADNQVVASTTTDGDGEFAFTEVAAGSYTVVAVDLTGYTSTTSNQSSANVTAGETVEVAFGDLRTSTVTLPTQGYIWGFVIEDLDEDGEADSDEIGLAGVTVELFDESDNSLGIRVADANGFFDFGSRAAGSYRLVFTPPDGYEATSLEEVQVTLVGEALVTQIFAAAPADPTPPPDVVILLPVVSVQ